MARKRFIAGNWKMNKTPSEAVALIRQLLPSIDNSNVDVVFCVPSIDIIPAVEATKDSSVSIGAQNFYFQEMVLTQAKFHRKCWKMQGLNTQL